MINAQEYLFKIPYWTKKKNSLSDVREFVKALGSPDQGMNIIHVAGTNGKGSVCAYLTFMLLEAGYHVGTFVSPHLTNIRERFLIDGEMVKEEPFSFAFCRVYDVTRDMVKRGYCHPTFFEFLFLMSLVIFSREKLDYVILETGLGGRLDTTNICYPKLTVITSISLDHTGYLGNTISQIAGEKAGIIKEGIPIVYDDCQKEASQVIFTRAKELFAPAYPVEEHGMVEAENLIADYQKHNAFLACQALSVLLPGKIPDELMKAGIGNTRWPGRMEQVLPGIYLDGAHNTGGISAFIKAVQMLQEERPLYLLFAAVSDKDYKEMIQKLCRNLPLKGVAAAHINQERGTEADLLINEFRAAGCHSIQGFQSVEEALSFSIIQKGREGVLFCVGSLYLIGEIKDILKRSPDFAQSKICNC